MADNITIRDGLGVKQTMETAQQTGGEHRPVHSVSSDGPQKKHIVRHLDTNGDGTGLIDATGDYSAAEEIFYIQPPAGSVYRIARMLVHVEDSGTIDSGKYGNGIVLTNGITVRSKDDTGVIVDYCGGHPIIVNQHWAMMCYDVTRSNYGAGNEHLNARWTFSKSGQFMRLVGDNNERLEIVFNDDFTGLVAHHFTIQGYIE